MMGLFPIRGSFRGYSRDIGWTAARAHRHLSPCATGVGRLESGERSFAGVTAPMAEPARETIRGPFAWHGADLAAGGSWLGAWSADELAELDRAVAAVRCRGLAWHSLAKEDFPLDAVAGRLAGVARELEEGTGFVKLTGLPVDRYEPDDLKVLWMGLARHLGQPVFQDCNGQLMREIRDEGGDLGDAPRAAWSRPARRGRRVFLSSKARTYSSGELALTTPTGLRRGRPAGGAPGQDRRRQQDRQRGHGDPQRHAGAPARTCWR